MGKAVPYGKLRSREETAVSSQVCCLDLGVVNIQGPLYIGHPFLFWDALITFILFLFCCH